MNSRALKRWRIDSKQRLQELKAFSWQYNDWIEALKEISELPAHECESMPRSTNISDPVAHIAEKRDVYKTKINMVDWAISICSDDSSMRHAVRKAVTTPGGLSFTWLKLHDYLNYERDAYYEALHKYYYVLDQIKI